MTIDWLKDKAIGILGYGREGQSVARYLTKHGITPVLFDIDAKNVQDSGYEYFSGDTYLNNLVKVEILFRSPGFWRLDKKLIEYESHGGIITSQTQLFFENCPCPVVGVTGTKGKGTTTSLAYDIAKRSGKNAFLTGNIGLTEPLDFLDSLHQSDIVYYELSSFQLQDLNISPHIGVVLMVTADHLDQHSSLSEYHEAKQSIAVFQSDNDFVIINKDFPASINIGAQGKGKKLWYGTSKIESGIQLEKDCIKIVNLQNYGLENQTLITLEEAGLRGEHNLQNIAAACLTAIVQEFPIQTIRQAVKEFTGLEHRLEFVIQNKGVKFYNDSFSTNPETAIAAIRSFPEPLHIILGGSDKNLDYTELAAEIKNNSNIASINLIGEISKKIETSLLQAQVQESKINSIDGGLEAVFEILKNISKPGDVVLLSPATASFDMFPNYKARGQKFKDLAKAW